MNNVSKGTSTHLKSDSNLPNYVDLLKCPHKYTNTSLLKHIGQSRTQLISHRFEMLTDLRLTYTLQSMCVVVEEGF